jgi:hypothetical protein
MVRQYFPISPAEQVSAWDSVHQPIRSTSTYLPNTMMGSFLTTSSDCIPASFDFDLATVDIAYGLGTTPGTTPYPLANAHLTATAAVPEPPPLALVRTGTFLSASCLFFCQRRRCLAPLSTWSFWMRRVTTSFQGGTCAASINNCSGSINDNLVISEPNAWDLYPPNTATFSNNTILK